MTTEIVINIAVITFYVFFVVMYKASKNNYTQQVCCVWLVKSYTSFDVYFHVKPDITHYNLG